MALQPQTSPPPPLASFRAVVLLALVASGWCLVLASAGRMPGARDLCLFELPTEVNCTLEPAAPRNHSCKIYKLPSDSCFQRWSYCRDKKTFIENEHFSYTFDEERNITDLTIGNIAGNRLLLTTMMPEEVWWQVDLPEGEYNISISGLPGHLNETNPITQPAFCEECPPPRVEYIALRKMHKFNVMVSPTDDALAYDEPYNVAIWMVSSNETNFSSEHCSDLGLTFIKVASGVTNKTLSIEEVYSTEFCFIVNVSIPSSNVTISANNRRYSCSLQKNMTELPYRPFEAHMEVPLWWTVGLVTVLICSAIAAFVLLAIYKGLLRAPCGRRTPRPDGDGECCSEDERRPRPVLRADAAAATSPADETCSPLL